MSSALLIAALWLAADPVDHEPAKEAPKQEVQSAARLKLMKETAARIEIHVKANEGKKLELRAQPVMRWDNQRSFVVDGAAFVWLADHRPQVIGGMWLKRGQEQTWFELHSLSPQRLTASVDGTTRWSTSRPGISWQALTGGPPPATSRAERLRQMKQIAEDFSAYAVKTGPDYDDGSVWHLRMMAQPVYRYAEEAPVDGSIFAFSQGVDPEVFLILESREDNGIAQWHFGFARACVWELHAKRGDHEVWSQPKWSPQDADKVYGLVGPFAVDPSLLQLAQEPAN
jgi:hypothetical protein